MWLRHARSSSSRATLAARTAGCDTTWAGTGSDSPNPGRSTAITSNWSARAGITGFQAWRADPRPLLALTELDSFPRFLTGTEAANVEERGHAAMAQARTETGMHIGDDWTRRLAEAGLTVEAERRFDIALDPPLPDLAHRYAQVSLQRMRHGTEGRVSADDLTALDTLLDAVLDRDDLTIRAARTVLVGRRPSSMD
jgi:hypothetical protein